MCLKFVIYMLRKSLLPLFFISTTTNAFPLQDEENSIEKPAADLSYLGESAFLETDPETVNPEELGGYAEGDIIFSQRNGVIDKAKHWENRVVPYEIAGEFSPSDLNTITEAINMYKNYTCITFRPKIATDEDYISIVNYEKGCSSNVGRVGGKQIVNLETPSCTKGVGHILHELMHALGFLHEQNRYERDDFVTIVRENIEQDLKRNFDKAEKCKAEGFGVPYDFHSIMHYPSKGFSKNNESTIIPKDLTRIKEIGQRKRFSRGDITKINAMYECPEKTWTIIKYGTPHITSTATSSSVNENNDKKLSSNPLIDAATGLVSLFIH